MEASRETLKDQLERYEQELDELNSFITELKTTSAKHGTPTEHIAEDLSEAEHNVVFYESEIARIKEKLQERNWRLPHRRQEVVGGLIISSISFVVGMLIGSRLGGGKDRAN